MAVKQEIESEKYNVTELDTGNFKIKVTRVGTLDMENFIEMAMSLPPFCKK